MSESDLRKALQARGYTGPWNISDMLSAYDQYQ